MLQNAYFLATIGADTAENERHFANDSEFRRTQTEPCTSAGTEWPIPGGERFRPIPEIICNVFRKVWAASLSPGGRDKADLLLFFFSEFPPFPLRTFSHK